jgi:hypothetical protein
MKTTAAFFPLLLVLLGLLASGPLRAAPLAPGDRLPDLTLSDQHGSTRRIDADARIILFAPDREAGNLIQGALSGLSQVELDARGVQVVYDISSMPRTVTRMFALPAMRKYGHSILLGRSPEDTVALPRRPGRSPWLVCATAGSNASALGPPLRRWRRRLPSANRVGIQIRLVITRLVP